MAIDSVKIPQNVYREERIVGPISLRQIFILLIGGGISYAFWNTLKAAGYVSIVSTAIGWSPLLVAAAFSFVKINDISLLRLILLMAEGTQKPSVRQWSPRQGISINFKSVQSGSDKATDQRTATKTKDRGSIEELSSFLDTVETMPSTLVIDDTEQTGNETLSATPGRVSVDASNDRTPVDTIRQSVQPRDDGALSVLFPQ